MPHQVNSLVSLSCRQHEIYNNIAEKQCASFVSFAPGSFIGTTAHAQPSLRCYTPFKRLLCLFHLQNTNMGYECSEFKDKPHQVNSLVSLDFISTPLPTLTLLTHRLNWPDKVNNLKHKLFQYTVHIVHNTWNIYISKHMQN